MDATDAERAFPEDYWLVKKLMGDGADASGYKKFEKFCKTLKVGRARTPSNGALELFAYNKLLVLRGHRHNYNEYMKKMDAVYTQCLKLESAKYIGIEKGDNDRKLLKELKKQHTAHWSNGKPRAFSIKDYQDLSEYIVEQLFASQQNNG